MKILGIDPGSSTTGYGIIEKNGNIYTAVTWGKINPKSTNPFPVKLKEIHDGVEEIILNHRPEVVAVENIFFSDNANTALKLGHARAAAIIAALRHNIEVEEYSPLEIKMAVTGYGRADKKQVMSMVSHILKLGDALKVFDISDALAVAICHASVFNMKRQIKNAESQSHKGTKGKEKD